MNKTIELIDDVVLDTRSEFLSLDYNVQKMLQSNLSREERIEIWRILFSHFIMDVKDHQNKLIRKFCPEWFPPKNHSQVGTQK